MPTLFKSDDIDQVDDRSINAPDTDQSNDIDFMPPPLVKSPETTNKEPKKGENVEKLNQAVQTAKRPLFKAQTVFPFDFFPDIISIDENKVDIISGNFFLSKDIYSIPIQNISAVNSSFDIFFGQLRIEAWGLNRVPLPIKFLWKKDALEARRIINGLILTNKQDINMRNIPIEETRHKLEVIGSV